MKISNCQLSIVNFKIIIPLLLLLLMVLGCQLSVEKPSRDGTGNMAIKIEMDAEDAPDSHRGDVKAPPAVFFIAKIFKSDLKGLDYWKANHPNLTTGTANPRFIYKDEDGEFVSCLDCHTAETSCNNCHGYVGVVKVTGGDEEEDDEVVDE
jgi:hypothetical protein